MPESTKDFLHLCCSQKIPLPEGQYKRSKFAGSLIKRIVREGWVRIDTIDDERVYAKGKYEKPALKHDRRGILSMNLGPRGALSSHVIIALDQHPWMDKLYRAIGVLIDGEHVLHMLENVKTTYDNPDIDVIITGNGILYSPNLMTSEGFQSPEMKDASEKLKAFKDEYRSVLAAYVNSAQCMELAVKGKPKDDSEDMKVESEQCESDADGVEVVQSGLFIPASQASLFVSKSRIANSDLSQSKVAVWGSEKSLAKDASMILSPSFREISERRASKIPSFGSGKMVDSSKSKINFDPVPTVLDKTSGLAKSSESIKQARIESGKSLPGEYEDIEKEEFGEDMEIRPQLSEADIQYTYVVPKSMIDIRLGYKTFSEGKRPEQYQKVGLKLPMKGEYEEKGKKAQKQFAYEEPHQRIEKDGKFNYYEFSKKAMTQVTPKLLLAWAEGIDDDEQIVEIEKAVNELLETAMKADGMGTDSEGHPLDTVSMEDTRERFRKCLLSMPTQLLQMLHEAMHEIFVRQDCGTEPFVVTGESTSQVNLDTVRTKNMRALSEDVISGVMFSLIEFTKRMIESSTELVPDMKNFEYVTGLIDDVILQKVHKFLKKKRKNDKRFKKNLPFYESFTPGDAKTPFMKDLKKSSSSISYLDRNLLPMSVSGVSAGSEQYMQK